MTKDRPGLIHSSGESIQVEIEITHWDYITAQEIQAQDRLRGEKANLIVVDKVPERNDEILLGEAEMCNLNNPEPSIKVMLSKEARFEAFVKILNGMKSATLYKDANETIPPYEPGPYIEKVEAPFVELYGGPKVMNPGKIEFSILKTKIGKYCQKIIDELTGNTSSFEERMKKKLQWKLAQREGKLLHCWFSDSMWNHNGGVYYILEDGKEYAVTAALENSRTCAQKDSKYIGLGAFSRTALNNPVAYEVRHGMTDKEMQELIRRKQEIVKQWTLFDVDFDNISKVFPTTEK